MRVSECAVRLPSALSSSLPLQRVACTQRLLKNWVRETRSPQETVSQRSSEIVVKNSRRPGLQPVDKVLRKVILDEQFFQRLAVRDERNHGTIGVFVATDVRVYNSPTFNTLRKTATSNRPRRRVPG